MKVTHLTSWLSSRGGGIPAVVAPLCKQIAEISGMEPSVIGLSQGDEFLTDQDWGKVLVTAHRPIDGAFLGYAPRMRQDLQELKPAVVHVHGLWSYTALLSKQWAARTGRPYIVSPHGMLEPWALNNSRWKKRIAETFFQREQLRSAVCLHALNDAELEDIRAYGLTNPVAVLPNGIDLPEVSASAFPIWKAGVPKGNKVLLFLGRLHPKKNIQTLLTAWASIRHVAKTNGWQLVIAGWGKTGCVEELQRLIADLCVGDSVLLIGPQFGADKFATFQSADAFVLPSLSEGLPMAVLEAWAFGLPVLMSRACNIPMGFTEGVAIEVPVQEEALAKKLVSFFNERPGKLLEMGARGREMVQTHYSWEKIASSMADLYLWANSGGEPPSFVSM